MNFLSLADRDVRKSAGVFPAMHGEIFKRIRRTRAFSSANLSTIPTENAVEIEKDLLYTNVNSEREYILGKKNARERICRA